MMSSPLDFKLLALVSISIAKNGNIFDLFEFISFISFSLNYQIIIYIYHLYIYNLIEYYLNKINYGLSCQTIECFYL